MEKKQTAVFQLLSAIPTGAEIKQFIFDNDADEKMLDEWLWANIYKAKDWKQMEREQIEEAYKQGDEDGFHSTESMADYEIEGRSNYLASKYFTQTFKP